MLPNEVHVSVNEKGTFVNLGVRDEVFEVAKLPLALTDKEMPLSLSVFMVDLLSYRSLFVQSYFAIQMMIYLAA
jgi:hypothetical protein